MKKKRIISLLLVLCLASSMLLCTACSETEVAAIREELSDQYEWELLKNIDVNGEELSIHRRHDKGFLGVHSTYFKIAIYDTNDNCTHFYSSGPTPCKNGWLKCEGAMASLEDAAEKDSVIAEIHPYVQNVQMNEAAQKMLSGKLSTDELKNFLFRDDVVGFFEKEQEAIISQTPSDMCLTGISNISQCNDLLSKMVEAGIGIYEAIDSSKIPEDGESVEGSIFLKDGTVDKEQLKQIEIAEQVTTVGLIREKWEAIVLFFTGELYSDRGIGGIEKLIPNTEIKSWEYDKRLEQSKKDSIEAVKNCLEEQ